MAIIFGAVADDHAGATELAGTLADRGMRPILILDELWRQDFETWTRHADAVVIATESRVAQRDAAYESTRRAIRLLETISPHLLQVTYSSALAAAEGNIGASIDAAMDETHEEFTIALPDSSLAGETAHGRLASLLPMQSKRRVGLVSSDDIAQGTARIQERLAKLRAGGVEIAVLDFSSEQNPQTTCEALSDLSLITGSSVLARFLPTSWAPSKLLYPQRRTGGRGFLVIAGSHAPATRHQNAWLSAHGAVTITLDAMNLAIGTMPDSVLTPICEELASGGTCLLQVSADTQTAYDYFRDQGKPRDQAGLAIARSLASFVRDVMSMIAPEGLIATGGETASVLSHVLGFGALAVGPTIEPGIPVCITLSGSALPVIVKSGSKGTESFYRRAIDTIRGLEYLDERATAAE